jgi:soluble lytic murein transglycosylase-like protein
MKTLRQVLVGIWLAFATTLCAPPVWAQYIEVVIIEFREIRPANPNFVPFPPMYRQAMPDDNSVAYMPRLQHQARAACPPQLWNQPDLDRTYRREQGKPRRQVRTETPLRAHLRQRPNEGTYQSPAQRLARRDSSCSQDELIARAIAYHAKQNGVDPFLVAAMIRVESGFDPIAISSAGACGLMQLMPGTSRSLGVSDPFDPVENVAGGTRYLREQIDGFGSISLALAAYNAGPQTVRDYGGIPPYRETQAYVRRVLDQYQKYARH